MLSDLDLWFTIFILRIFALVNLRVGLSCVNPTEAKDCELKLKLTNVKDAFNPKPIHQNVAVLGVWIGVFVGVIKHRKRNRDQCHQGNADGQ